MTKQATNNKKSDAPKPAAKKSTAPETQKPAAKKTLTVKKTAPAVKKSASVKKTPVAAKKIAVKKAAQPVKPAAAKKSPVASSKPSAAPKNDLKTRIISVIESGAAYAAVATVGSGKKPYVRIMSLKNKGLELASATFTKSKKVGQIKLNNSVSISILKEYSKKMADYIVIEASASICLDAKTKKEFWSEGLANYFKGPDDPNYCVLKFKPLSIEFNDAKTFKTETLLLTGK
jgi:general stress protein 26